MSYGPEIKVLTGLHYLPAALMRVCFVFPTSRGCLHSFLMALSYLQSEHWPGTSFSDATILILTLLFFSFIGKDWFNRISLTQIIFKNLFMSKFLIITIAKIPLIM
jgi:hypothetical protein